MLVLRYSTSQARQLTRSCESIEQNEGLQDQVECGEGCIWASLKPTQRRGGRLAESVNNGRVETGESAKLRCDHTIATRLTARHRAATRKEQNRYHDG